MLVINGIKKITDVEQLVIYFPTADNCKVIETLLLPSSLILLITIQKQTVFARVINFTYLDSNYSLYSKSVQQTLHISESLCDEGSTEAI